MSNETYSLLSAQPKMVPMQIAPEHTVLKNRGWKLYEFPSLHNLWKHCHANPTDIVFYMHTKTAPLKRFLMEKGLFSNPGRVVELLSKGLDKIWVYSSASSCREHPWCHSQGNFWWARCDHIIRLNDPFNKAAILEGDGDYSYWPPRGRFWAEYWLLSDWLGPRPPPMVEKPPHGCPWPGGCGRPGYPEDGNFICKEHVRWPTFPRVGQIAYRLKNHLAKMTIRDWDGAEFHPEQS